jgi:transcriptional regulator with XRE-family HTH domain
MGQIDKNLKNELFKVAIDYIYKEHLVGSQGELADKIGISASALSRIMNDKKFVGDDTLRKMNEAFGGIFNMAYFRGESTILLVKDIKDDHPTPSQPESDILELCARMIRKLDDTRVELKKEIAEVRQLKDELRLTLSHLKGTTYSTPDEAPRLAAEDFKTK